MTNRQPLRSAYKEKGASEMPKNIPPPRTDRPGITEADAPKRSTRYGE